MPYKPKCGGLGAGWSQNKTDYYAMYYQMYKHRYKYRYLEKKNEKNKIDLNLDYKQELINRGLLIIK
jgi:hypothetical protein